MLIRNFIDAFQSGKELASATTWKKAQVLTAKLTIFLGAVAGISVAFGYDPGLSEQQIIILASALSIIAGMFNGTATVVSTKRIGLSPRRKHPPAGGSDGNGNRGDSDDGRQLRLDYADTNAPHEVSILGTKGG